MKCNNLVFISANLIQIDDAIDTGGEGTFKVHLRLLDVVICFDAKLLMPISTTLEFVIAHRSA